MALSTNLQQKELLASLQSNDAKITEKALTSLKKEGNSALLPSLFQIYVHSSNQDVKNGLENVFNQLKEPASVDYLVKALQNKEYKDLHNKFAAAIWESGLDAASHLCTLVEIASNTDYMTCLEILTIIENIEEGFNENDIEQCIATISEQLQWKKSDNDPLLASIAHVLQNVLVD